jgi:hypothetical protein
MLAMVTISSVCGQNASAVPIEEESRTIRTVMERLMAVKKLCASEHSAVTIRGKDEEVRTLSARELTLSGQQTQKEIALDSGDCLQ